MVDLMNPQKKNTDQYRIASPCSAKWNQMIGDDEARLCFQCNRKVYNFGEMSPERVKVVLSNAQGRICGRLLEPTIEVVSANEHHSIIRNVKRVSSAMLSALIVVGTAESKTENSVAANIVVSKLRLNSPEVQEQRSQQETGAQLLGTVSDHAGAVIPNAVTTLTNNTNEQVRNVRSDDEGVYRFSSLGPGVYTLKVQSPGFTSLVVENILLALNEKRQVNATLEVDGGAEVVGIFVTEPEKGLPRKIADILLLPYRGLKRLITRGIR